MLPFGSMMQRSRKKRVRFNPTSVSGLALWFDAASGVYTDDAATTLAAADGDAVGAWVDRSSNARQFIQATSGNKPTLKTGANGINGHPVIRADGSADHLKLASAVLSASSGSVFAVFRLTAAVQSTEILLSSCDEASTSRLFDLYAFNTATTRPNIAIRQRNADTLDTVIGNTELVADTVYLAGWESTGTAWGLRLNGAAQTVTAVAGSDTGDWTADTSGRDNTLLFAGQTSAGVNSYFKGDLAELMVYEPQISSADRALIEGYLLTKYAMVFP